MLDEFGELDFLESYLVEKWMQETEMNEADIAHAIRTMREIFAEK